MTTRQATMAKVEQAEATPTMSFSSNIAVGLASAPDPIYSPFCGSAPLSALLFRAIY